MTSIQRLILMAAVTAAAAAAAAATSTGTCDATSFPRDLTDQECMGLKATSPAMGAQTATACMQACCDDPACRLWQWCDDSTPMKKIASIACGSESRK